MMFNFDRSAYIANVLLESNFLLFGNLLKVVLEFRFRMADMYHVDKAGL